MHWYSNKKFSKKAIEQAKLLAPKVAAIFKSMKRCILASSRPVNLNLNIDPKLAEQFNINFRMIQEADNPEEMKIITASNNNFNDNFKEQFVTFPSKRTRDPNYLCSIIFQKPEDSVYCISTCMTDTYLGRYVYRANWFFRDSSRSSAMRCFNRIIRTVQDIKSDFVEGTRNQNEIPYALKKSLQGESGEIEEKSNKIATYLDPDNIAPQTTIGQNIFAKGPTTHSILDDLESFQ